MEAEQRNGPPQPGRHLAERYFFGEAEAKARFPVELARRFNRPPEENLVFGHLGLPQRDPSHCVGLGCESEICAGLRGRHRLQYDGGGPCLFSRKRRTNVSPVSLSFCCLTNGPAGRIGALLDLLRPVADEIVVAVDQEADGETLRVCAAFADDLIRVPHAPPLERSLAWLHAQCSATWILRLDSDEIPSAALLDALPSLAAAKDVAYCCLTRRWLYPDPARYLDLPPWQPDYQIRLVRNDAAFLTFPGEMHTSAHVDG